MESKKFDKLFSLSLLTIGITAIVLSGSRIVGIQMPYSANLALVIIELIAAVVLVYSGIKKIRLRKK